MTIASTTRKVTYTGNGATTTYPIPFTFKTQSQVVVTRTVNGLGATLTNGVEYTISGSNVVLATALTTGGTLVIQRRVSATQDYDLSAMAPVPNSVIEDAIDHSTMLVQQSADDIVDLQASDASLSSRITAEELARAASIAAEKAAILAAFATELAAVRTELDSAPGSTVDARTVLATLGITSRTLAAHMKDKLGILDFGASTAAAGATNDAAITAALAAMTDAFVPAGAYTVTTMPDVSRLYGPGTLVLGGLTVYLGGNPSPPILQNILPNTQWQIGSGHGIGTKMNHQGTGTKVALNITSYETGTNTPWCYCADMADLKVQDLLAFAVPAEQCFRTTLVEVTEVGADGFRVLLPLGKKPAASVACTALPSMNGGTPAGSGDAFDGWSRTPSVPLTGVFTWTNGSPTVTGVGTLFTSEIPVGTRIKASGLGNSAYFTVQSVESDTSLTLTTNFGPISWAGVSGTRAGPQTWREDHSVNTKVGSKYSCGFRKALTPAEHLSHQIPARLFAQVKGKRIVFGVGVMHKVRNGSGTWRVRINTDGTGGGLKYSPASSAAVGAWDWREVSTVVPSDATYCYVDVEFNGNARDTYYVTQPMAALGRYIGPWNYSQPKGEYFIPIVHGQFYSFINTSPHLPSGIDGLGKGNDTDLQGSDNGAHKTFPIAPYPETNGIIAPTVKELVVKIEGRCETIGDAWGLSNNWPSGTAHVFGPLLYSQTVGYMMPPQKGSIPLDANGRCHVISGLSTLTGLVTFTNGSATVTGVGTKFLTELSNGMLVKLNNDSGNKFYRVKSRASDTSLTLGVPGGADATYDEATVAGAGMLKSDANWYNFAIEANAYVLS